MNFRPAILKIFGAGLLFSLVGGAQAWALSFGMPLHCNYGVDCFIQNYVDDAPSSDARDYHCSGLTYHGHKGTDFRLRNFTQMQQGVDVLAAADGTVLRVRNDAPDTGLDAGREAVGDKECGNGLVIAHADGYESQYCHMKQGSIRVTPNAAVKAGDVLGQVGYSGMTEFPHVHFELRRDGHTVDPFNTSAPSIAVECGTVPVSAWSDNTALPYRDGVILDAGFADHVPQQDHVIAPLIPATQINATAPMLIFWVSSMGMKAGDQLVMRILSPTGETLVEKLTLIPSFKATWFQFIGKNLHAPLPAGDYSGEASILRDGKPLPSGQSRTVLKIVTTQ